MPAPDRAECWETTLEPLNPRAIQARVRAGDSPEVIAAETGWPLDRVERYAGPPLAERENIAALASATELRRSGAAVTLAESVEAVTGNDDATWDARRRPEDGRWVVVISVDGRPTAAWTYDVAGRSVQPLDDEARRLMGVAPAPAAKAAMREAAPVAHPSTRDTAILSAVRPDRAQAERARTEHQQSDRPERPHLVSVPPPADDSDVVDDLDIADVVEAADIADDAYLAEVADEETSAHATTHDRADGHATGDEADPLADLPPAAGMQETLGIPTPKTTKRKPRKRASVPTWDEILFGSKSSDD